MPEPQRYERIEVALKIRVTWPGKGTTLGITRYVSDDETLLVAAFDESPEPGVQLLLQLEGTVFDQAAPVIRATVLQVNGQEITLRLPVQEPI